jgi:hypothetical protein
MDAILWLHRVREKTLSGNWPSAKPTRTRFTALIALFEKK